MFERKPHEQMANIMTGGMEKKCKKNELYLPTYGKESERHWAPNAKAATAMACPATLRDTCYAISEISTTPTDRKPKQKRRKKKKKVLTKVKPQKQQICTTQVGGRREIQYIDIDIDIQVHKA